ncbi:MAG: NAD-dependent epimerase/dehydratase family protein [Nitrososphaera sp.]|uniref:Putative UDP-glucose 4-epimerase n=1 Tax=Nitrososphaera gargensis (strain Ga9.2) TaxID=1237085 RepID=K0INE8_NITGG|nr:NAD-dependent epimerase/dehydratase family protein [Candidatus Nitrososphaera gargensis]AFU59249.1 putative UDP-glucose 4-epimerase [Candidatus Nitrososphaera gargensis Ga9.2]
MRIAKALVTGGAGFIGSHIVDELIARGIETYVIDNLSTGTLNNLVQHRGNSLLHFMAGDVREAEALLQDTNIDVVFHEAAIASVPKSVSHPLLVHDVNVNMTLHLLNYCVKSGVKRFIFASSAAVYGILESKATEDMACRPNSPYGAGKLAIEDYLHAYRRTYGLETVMLRYFNVYGPRQIYSDYSGVITIFINKLLEGERPVIFGDGLQVRDFVHVSDIVQANMLAMDSAAAVGEMFNVASGRATNILEMVKIIKKLMGATDIEHQFAPPRPGDMKLGLASIDKIRAVLGYDPKIQIQQGLKGVIESISKIQVPKIQHAGEAT